MNRKIFLLTIVVATLFFSVSLFNHRVASLGWEADQEKIVFNVDSGQGVIEIADNLKRKGIINDKFVFLGQIALTNNIGNLQAGRYELDSEMSIERIVDLFSSGETIFETVTIIEGWTIVQIATHLENEGVVSREDFFEITGLPAPQAKLLGLSEKPAQEFDYPILQDLSKEISLEGYLFPDTYRIENDSPERLIEKMIANLENRLTEEMHAEIERRDKNVFEIINMASMIEREVPDYEDMEKVSDILWRRKEAGIPLQVDATVNYVTGRRGIDVTAEETKIQSPYNTYAVTGLPKGPISNPGMNAIEAAIYPTENNYWYYLSDPETGDTIFSRNHFEHVQAKNQYLR